MHDHYEHDLEAAAEACVRDTCAGLDRPQDTGQPTRGELAALRLLYGERIAEARKLADVTVTAMAERIGLDRHQVTLLEQGRMGDPPAWLLARVATATGVRLDFLAGLSDESEQGEDSELYEIVMAQMLRADTQRAVHAVEDAQQKWMIADLERQGSRYRIAAAELVEAFLRFIDVNNEQWQDMPGGARLIAAIAACEQSVMGSA